MIEQTLQAIKISGISLWHFWRYAGGFVQEVAIIASHCLTTAGMHVHGVIRNRWCGCARRHCFHHPIQQIIAAALFFALAEEAHCVDSKQISISSRSRQTTLDTIVFDRLRRDGAVHRRVLEVALRAFGRYEIELLLARAGLRLAHVYGAPDLSPYDDASDSMIIVAEAAPH